MNSFRADLHVHSHFSDGSNSPEKLLYLAKEINLSGISITDHDTIEAYNESLFKLADNLGIKLVTGVEISSELNDVSVHILGYNFDVLSQSLKEFLIEVQKKRKLRNIEILKKLEDQNIFISEKELYEFTLRKNIAHTIVGRVHIAQLMHERGYVTGFQQAFDDYIADNAPCFVKGYKFPPKQIIDQIHLAHGKAVLAHPNLIKNRIIINMLLELNFDGLEAYYAKLPPAQEAKWINLAKKRNLLITGGSDFHGDIKPFISLGCSWIDEDNFNKLIK